MQQLAKYGTYEQQQACSQQLEDVRSSLRFVQYELGRKGQQSSSAVPDAILHGVQVRCILPLLLAYHIHIDVHVRCMGEVLFGDSVVDTEWWHQVTALHQ